MVKTFIAVACVALLASPAVAQGNGIGLCISDGFYGNQPNIVDPFVPGGPQDLEPGTKAHRIVPSQSPGPFVTNPQTGEVTRGSSLGDFHDLFDRGELRELCGL